MQLIKGPIRYRMGLFDCPKKEQLFPLVCLYMPCLVFDANGKCVDKSRNYNDDHLFIHRWPSLFPGIESCKCGRAIDAKEEQKK